MIREDRGIFKHETKQRLDESEPHFGVVARHVLDLVICIASDLLDSVDPVLGVRWHVAISVQVIDVFLKGAARAAPLVDTQQPYHAS